MSARTHSHAGARRNLHWLAVAPLATLGMMTMASPSDDGPTLCPVALLTGVACPGCGMTRALAWLVRGDLGTALTYHPLAPLVIALIVVATGWALGRRFRGWRPPSSGLVNGGLIGLAALFVSVWVARLVSGSLPPV
jgi:Protein of unknown function (DUF2752)